MDELKSHVSLHKYYKYYIVFNSADRSLVAQTAIYKIVTYLLPSLFYCGLFQRNSIQLYQDNQP